MFQKVIKAFYINYRRYNFDMESENVLINRAKNHY